jgi:hypothetical protein
MLPVLARNEAAAATPFRTFRRRPVKKFGAQRLQQAAGAKVKPGFIAQPKGNLFCTHRQDLLVAEHKPS